MFLASKDTYGPEGTHFYMRHFLIVKALLVLLDRVAFNTVCTVFQKEFYYQHTTFSK